MSSFKRLANGSVTTPRGFRAAGVTAGFKRSGAPDFAMLVSDVPANFAGAFTSCTFAAAPVQVCRKRVLFCDTIRAAVINSGNANACTGDTGISNAEATCVLAANKLGINSNEVVVSSPGRIGTQLPMDTVKKGIELAVASLSEEGGELAAQAIMTTDTVPKSIAVELELDGVVCSIGAMTKGAGMIDPSLKVPHATMLCYITTDVKISNALLSDMIEENVAQSFNRITIDGDMSTNDMVIVMANGAAGNAPITEENEDYAIVKEALDKLCKELAKEIADDGEGATKFLTVHVTGTKTFADAKTIGMSVAKSPLVKTAFFGADPNWGRVICAVGYAGVPMDPEDVVVKFGDVPVYAHGVGAEHDAEALAKVMEQHDITISIDMGQGEEEATVWTCDFSYEYVKINGEYHT